MLTPKRILLLSPELQNELNLKRRLTEEISCKSDEVQLLTASLEVAKKKVEDLECHIECTKAETEAAIESNDERFQVRGRSDTVVSLTLFFAIVSNQTKL